MPNILQTDKFIVNFSSDCYVYSISDNSVENIVHKTPFAVFVKKDKT